MKKVLFGILVLFAAVSLHAQTYTVSTASNCGRVSSPLYCYNIPLKDANDVPAGTFWLDTYTSGSNAGTGFVVWYAPLTLPEATVTSNTPTASTFVSNGHSITAVSSLTVDFKGGDEAQGTYYSGTMTLNFTYYYSSGGGGRGGAGAGWRFIVTGGTVTINPALSPTANSPIAPTPVCEPQPDGSCKKVPNNPW